MPWTVKDVDRHKKGLTPTQKKKWVSIANGVLKSCKAKGGKGCEGKAIRIANSKFEEKIMDNIESKEIPRGALCLVDEDNDALAFVDFGIGKNGFLHTSDLHPRYFPKADSKTTENIGRRIALKDRAPIQKSLRKGQEIIVQVIKEGINTKGPTLTTYISLPGKYLVLMP